MTEKESIEIEKYLLDGYKKPNYKLAEKIMEAVEKQIPKKPTEDGYYDKPCVCSYCGQDLNYIECAKYCKNCGQALDWSDT